MKAVGFFYGRIRCKAWWGQAGRQSPQPRQLDASTVAVLRPQPSARAVTKVKAWLRQAATQRPQPVQCAVIWRGTASRFTRRSESKVAFDEFFDDAELSLQLVIAIFQLDDLVPEAGLPFLEDHHLCLGIFDHPA